MSAYPFLESLSLPEDLHNLSYKELEQVAAETRRVIIDAVSKNGGHLAPSLGVVELTVALLRVCDPLDDRIIWDVSHQSYAFKVLTDRLKAFSTLRTFGGISGFSKLAESPYDAFGTGHSSTSISAGMGILCADQILGRTRKVISVIGDGALSGGMAFEAMNNLGNSQKPMVVVLNDNEMSIGPNVGAISQSLSRMLTGEIANSIRTDIGKVISSLPVERLKKLANKFEDSIVSFFTPGILFEEFGLRYIGPINGHKIKDIEKALNTAFAVNGPALVHIATKKGMGYAPAEENPGIFHGVGIFNAETGEIPKSNTKTWTACFSESLISMAEEDSRIVGITSAMADGTGLKKFAEIFPDRFYDTGIAEQHAMTFAAGLAVAGARPYIAIYSTFIQRAYDQIIHDVALQNLPVRICIDRAGLVGQDGPTHHGAFDISFLRIIPNLTIMLPRDLKELSLMMKMSLDWDGPLALRYARGGAFEDESIPRSEIIAGTPEIIYEGDDFMIISAGHIFTEAYKFYTMLLDAGFTATLVNLRFLNPVNLEQVLERVGKMKAVFTFEENIKTGGVGEMIELAVKEYCPEMPVHIIALPDEYVTQGDVAELRKYCNLTAEYAMSIAKEDAKIR